MAKTKTIVYRKSEFKVDSVVKQNPTPIRKTRKEVKKHNVPGANFNF